MAIYSTGGTSTPDIYICLPLLILSVISTPLNTLVIRHNLLKPPSLPQKLFLMLGTADLLASLYIAVDFSVGGLSDRDMEECMKNLGREFCEQHYEVTYRDATVGDVIRTGMRQILTLTPCFLTGVLAVTRFYQIRYPLRHLRQRYIFGFLILNLVYICVVFVLFFRKGDPNNTSAVYSVVLQSVWNFDPTLFGYRIKILGLYIFIITPAMILQILTIITSILTIGQMIQMYKQPMSDLARRNSVSVSLKIMITNFGSITNMAVYGMKAYLSTLGMDMDLTWEENVSKAEETIPWFFEFVICYTAIVPVVLSTLNPVIYIAFTPEARQVRKQKVKEPSQRVNTVHGTVEGVSAV